MTPNSLSSEQQGDSQAPDLMSKQLIACAVVAAGARFVPLPFLDDVVKARANRSALHRALKDNGAQINITHLKPLYASGGALGFIVSLPFKLLFFPIRKFLRIVGAVRGVPRDLLETLLLTRTLARRLREDDWGALDRVEIRRAAKRMRKAFDRAFRGASWTFTRAALNSVTGGQKPAKVDEVHAVLSGDDIQRELAAFDERFDGAWASL